MRHRYEAMVLSVVMFAGACGGSANHGPYQEPQPPPYRAINWDALSLPVQDVSDLSCDGNRLYLASASQGLFISDDVGETWSRHAVMTPGYSGDGAGAISIDHGVIYVTNGLSVLVSNDDGLSFEQSFFWHYDPIRDIDCRDGYCWIVISNWGALSGPLFKEPNDGWHWKGSGIAWAYMSLGGVVIDPVDPARVAYVVSEVLGSPAYRTLNAGDDWTYMDHAIRYATILDGVSTGFSGTEYVGYINGMNRYAAYYTQNQGTTWRTYETYVNHPRAQDETSGDLFASGSALDTKGVYRGRPGHWVSCGLGHQLRQDEDILLMCVTDGYVFAITESRLFRVEVSATTG